MMAKTLRDEFAMAAMAGRLANGLPANPRYCYTIAAGMLEERKKQMAAENVRDIVAPHHLAQKRMEAEITNKGKSRGK
jgi:hypothetical protein